MFQTTNKNCVHLHGYPLVIKDGWLEITLITPAIFLLLKPPFPVDFPLPPLITGGYIY